jgi:transposase
MIVADGHGRPIGLHVDSAQPHESPLAEPTLATAKVPQRRGRPRTRPQELVADRAYDSRAFRPRLRPRGIKPTSPAFVRGHRRRPKRGRPICTGPSYRQRWQVERCFGWMDHDRRLVVRYERAVAHYQAFCLIAIIFWGCTPHAEIAFTRASYLYTASQRKCLRPCWGGRMPWARGVRREGP